ncbi:MAG: periplasmic heavy metal sensor [Robiginitomaculum sp.]|nr:periplasmic heavy metal sensor [Robiginitomaculum sp.]
MSTTPKTGNDNPNLWIFALIISIGLNGLLIGLLMANFMGPNATHMTKGKMLTTAPLTSAYEHPQKLLRRFEPRRRREIIAQAMQHSRLETSIPPRKLMRDLRKARKQTLHLLQSPDLNIQTLEAQLKKTRLLKDKLGRQGDILVLEIFKQLTPDERKAIGQVRRKNNRMIKDKHKN